MGAARRLCSGHRPEGAAWPNTHARVLPTPARGADVPLPASASGQTGRAGRAKRAD